MPLTRSLTLLKPKEAPKEDTEIEVAAKLLPFIQAEVLHEISNQVMERAVATRAGLAKLPERVRTHKKRKHKHKKGACHLRIRSMNQSL